MIEGFDRVSLTGEGFEHGATNFLSTLGVGLTPLGWWARTKGGSATDLTVSLDGDINAPVTALREHLGEDYEKLEALLEYERTNNPITWIPGSRERYGSERDWEAFVEQTDFYGYREVLEEQAAGKTLVLGACAEVTKADGSTFWDYRQHRRYVNADNLDWELRDLWRGLVAAQGRGERIMIPETLLTEIPQKRGSHAQHGGIVPNWGTMWLDIDIADGHDTTGTGLDSAGYRYLTDDEAFDTVTLALDALIGTDARRTIIRSGGGYQAHLAHPAITEQVRKDFGVFWDHYGKTNGVSIDARGGLRRTPLRVWGSFRIKNGTVRRLEIVERNPIMLGVLKPRESPFAELRIWAEKHAAAARRALPKKPVVEVDAHNDDEYSEFKPGQRLNLGVPAIRMLRAFFEIESNGNRFTVHRPDGQSGNPDDNAITTKFDEGVDTEIETVFFHDRGDAASLGFVSGYHVSSFDILVSRYGGGVDGAKLASLIIRRFNFDWRAVIAFAKATPDPKLVKKSLPGYERPKTLTVELRFDDIPGVLDQLASRFEGRYTLDGDCMVVGTDRLRPSEIVMFLIADGDPRKALAIMTKVLGDTK
jgi:hypothetical protein